MRYFCEFRQKESERLIAVRNFPVRLTDAFIAQLAHENAFWTYRPGERDDAPEGKCHGELVRTRNGLELRRPTRAVTAERKGDRLLLNCRCVDGRVEVLAEAQPPDSALDVTLYERLCGFAPPKSARASLDSNVLDELAEQWREATREEEEVVFRRQAPPVADSPQRADNAQSSNRRLKRLADVEDGLCPICYVAFSAEPARLPGCNHTFCLSCIGEWARVTNHCPLCKTAFDEILHGNARTRVEARKANFVHEEDSEERIIRNADDYCYACERSDNFNSLLICDHCLKKCCHLGCLDPPQRFIPESDWFCDYCVENEGVAARAPIANIFRKPRRRTRQRRARRRRAASEDESTRNAAREAPKATAARGEAPSERGVENFFRFVEQSGAASRDAPPRKGKRSSHEKWRDKVFDLVFGEFADENCK